MTSPSTASRLPAPLQTPLLREGKLWIKPEGGQLSGSVKYRMVYAKLEAAFRRGEIAPGTSLMEVTSGSTGVALAWAGQQLGLPVELHVYPSISPSKRSAMEELGAKLVVHDPARPVPDILSHVAAKAREGDGWHLNQYDRVSVAEAYAGLSAELLQQLEAHPAPRFFVCPVGTGGLIQGVGARLRTAYPGLRVVALEPLPGGAIDGIRNTELFHMGPLDPYDKSFPDEVARVAPPGKHVNFGGGRLGESASAAFDLATARDYSDALLIAPD